MTIDWQFWVKVESCFTDYRSSTSKPICISDGTFFGSNGLPLWLVKTP